MTTEEMMKQVTNRDISYFGEESKNKMSKSQRKLHQNGYKSPLAKTVIQEDLDGNSIKEWVSANQAVLVYGKGIKNNLTNNNKSAYGYKWKYKTS